MDLPTPENQYSEQEIQTIINQIMHQPSPTQSNPTLTTPSPQPPSKHAPLPLFLPLLLPNRSPSQSITTLTSQTLSAYNELRSTSLCQQIHQLEQQNKSLQQHMSTLTSTYQQKRDQYNQLQLHYHDLAANYQQLYDRFTLLEEQAEGRVADIERRYQRDWEIDRQNMGKERAALQARIADLQTQNRYITEELEKSQTEYKTLKTILSQQRKLRKHHIQQTSTTLHNTVQQLTTNSHKIIQLQQQVMIKTKTIKQKDEQLLSLEKVVREMNERIKNIQYQSSRLIMKERSISRKALDGIVITRKYSELELGKARGRERGFLQSQKQLIAKIKDISRNQSNIMDNTDKWDRKNSIKSLNTTLRLSKPDRQTASPFVSNFCAEEESQLDLSPIQPKPQKQQQSVQHLQRTSSTMRIIKPRCQIEIPNRIAIQNIGAGTPCFELERDPIFKAMKDKEIIKDKEKVKERKQKGALSQRN